MIIYHGPSQITGDPIVAIATGLKKSSANRKTGDLAQIWIIPAAEPAHVAIKSGLDAAVCGDCPHRRGQGGSCYVLPHNAPRSVWAAWKRGSYPQYDREVFRGRNVRLGAYGDPAAVPQAIWEDLGRVAGSIVGYTHRWGRPGVAPALKKFCMASCDTELEREIAKTLGWRTFRIRTPDAPKMVGEFICPASDEGNKRATCATCGLCNGTTGRAKDPCIVVHGNLTKRFAETVAKAYA